MILSQTDKDAVVRQGTKTLARRAPLALVPCSRKGAVVPCSRKGVVYLAMLALVTTACAAGLGGATNQRDNAVRRVALAHELQLRGPADEVLVDFGFLDWRDNLDFTGRRTVWLNPIAREEFFAERDASRTYIHLRSPIQQGEDVAMQVERGSSSGVQLHQLTLRHESGAWKVVADVAQP